MNKRFPLPRFTLAVILLAAALMACTLTADTRSALATGPTVPAGTSPPPPVPLSPVPIPTAPQAEVGGAFCVVAAHSLNVRACPGIDCAVIAWLKNGQEVDIEADGGEWLTVKLSDGQRGYVAGRYCEVNQ